MLAKHLGDLLVTRLGKEVDDGVIDNIATALMHVWGRADTHHIEFCLARDPDPRYRIAAAKSFALSSASPMTSEIEEVVRRLADDSDARVRYWGQLGLAEIESTRLEPAMLVPVNPDNRRPKRHGQLVIADYEVSAGNKPANGPERRRKEGSAS